MAVWHKLNSGVAAVLHGLVIGGTTNNRRTVQINYIESYPFEENPFKGSVFPIAELALTYYAFLLQAKRVRVVEALPEVVPYYVSRGFVVENPGAPRHSLVKELS